MTSSMRLEVDDRVALLTIDRPDKRNAMTAGMWQSLLDHIEVIREDPDIVAVVLRGVGGSFSAGGDLAELSSGDPQHVESYRGLAESAVLALLDLETPKIAQIEGACFGAGCSLALACDVRISSPDSVFGIPALKNGLVYERPFVQRLARVVGPGSASLLLYSGERWSAEEAASRGLVDRCTTDAAAAVEQLLTSLRGSRAPAIASITASIRAT